MNGRDDVPNNVAPSLKRLASLVGAERVHDGFRFGLLIELRQLPDRLRRVGVQHRLDHMRPLADALNQGQEPHVRIGEPLLLTSLACHRQLRIEALLCHPLGVASLELASNEGGPDAGEPPALPSLPCLPTHMPPADYLGARSHIGAGRLLSSTSPGSLGPVAEDRVLIAQQVNGVHLGYPSAVTVLPRI